MAFEHPKIVIVGAGAMGSLFGGLLAEGGARRHPGRCLAGARRRDQSRRAPDRRARRRPRRSASRRRSIRRRFAAADVVLFQCKAYANEAAARSVRHLVTGATVVISFQNGLGNEETLGRILGEAHVLGGLTAQGAVMVEAGVVRNFGDLPSYIGELGGGLSERASRSPTRSRATACRRPPAPTSRSRSGRSSSATPRSARPPPRPT